MNNESLDKKEPEPQLDYRVVSLNLEDLAVERLEPRLSLMDFPTCDVPGCVEPLLDPMNHQHDICFLCVIER